jgi:hypothetical protein
MVRKGTHETRIEEVRQALASLQKMQAELALRHPSTELAVCEGNSRELVVDERREQRTSSSLGGGVVVLLVLVAGAAGLVSYGPVKVPDWAKPYVGHLGAETFNGTPPPRHAIADHLPQLPRLAQNSEPAAAPTKHQTAGVEVSSPETVPPFEERRRTDEQRPARIASLPAPPKDLLEVEPVRRGPAPPPVSEQSPRTDPQPRPDSLRAAPDSSGSTRPAALPPPIPPADAKDVALRQAKSLFESNKIADARKTLMAFAPEENADIAWALARTYDPRHIRSVGGTPGEGDIRDAEKWYRRWYAVGVAQGLVSKQFRIERLISAMRQP